MTETQFKTNTIYENKESTDYGYNYKYFKIIRRTAKTIWWERVNPNGSEFTDCNDRFKGGKCLIKHGKNSWDKGEFIILKASYSTYKVYSKDIHNPCGYIQCKCKGNLGWYNSKMCGKNTMKIKLIRERHFEKVKKWEDNWEKGIKNPFPKDKYLNRETRVSV
jgi:hypothetical protein